MMMREKRDTSTGHGGKRTVGSMWALSLQKEQSLKA
jgi:hypothetical protein